jgi:hypothetical protein
VEEQEEPAHAAILASYVIARGRLSFS